MPNPIKTYGPASNQAYKAPVIPKLRLTALPLTQLSTTQPFNTQLAGSNQASIESRSGQSQRIVTATPLAMTTQPPCTSNAPIQKATLNRKRRLFSLGPLQLPLETRKPIFPLVVENSGIIPAVIIGSGYIIVKNSDTDEQEGVFKTFSRGFKVGIGPVHPVGILAIKQKGPRARVEVIAEDSAVKQYSSKYIVSPSRHIIDVGGTIHLIQDLATEGDASQFIERPDATQKDVITIIKHIAKGLKEVHKKGNIHRDVKPANMFIWRLPNGKLLAKLADFGLHMAACEARSSRAGTKEYVPPVVWSGECSQTKKADLYALGVSLKEMCNRIARHNKAQHKALENLSSQLMSFKPPTLDQAVVQLRKIAQMPTEQATDAVVKSDASDGAQSCLSSSGPSDYSPTDLSPSLTFSKGVAA